MAGLFRNQQSPFSIGRVAPSFHKLASGFWLSAIEEEDRLRPTSRTHNPNPQTVVVEVAQPISLAFQELQSRVESFRDAIVADYRVEDLAPLGLPPAEVA